MIRFYLISTILHCCSALVFGLYTTAIHCAVPISHLPDADTTLTDVEAREFYHKALLLQDVHPDSVVYYTQRAAEKYRASKNTADYAIILSIGAVALVEIGKENAGFQQAREALRIAEQTGDSLVLAYALHAVGHSAGQQLLTLSHAKVNDSTALLLLKKALDYTRSYTRSRKDSFLALECLNSIGRIFRKMHLFDSAIVYHSAARTLAARLHKIEQEAWALHSLCVCAEAQNNLPKALLFCLEALRLREQNGILLNLSVSLEYTSRLYLAMNNIEKSMLYAQRGLLVANTSVDVGVQFLTTHRMALVLEAQGKYKQALEYERQSNRLQDSLAAIEYNNDTRILAGEIELERAKREKIIAQKQNEQEQATVRQQKIIVLSIASIAVLLFVVVLTLIRSQNKIRQHNSQLQYANNTINQQFDELHLQSQKLATTTGLLHEANTFLQGMNNDLQEKDMEKNELMGIVSHDLQNPIGAIRGLAELIQTGFAKEEQVQEITGQIVLTSDRMLSLVKNLLDVNRLESGGMQFHAVPFDISPILESTVWQYTQPAEAKNITLHFTNEDASLIVIADEQATMQVLDNIISNAVKYSPHGKNVFVRVRHSSLVIRNSSLVIGHLPNEINAPMTNAPMTNALTTDYVRVEVQDEGPGISSEDMTKLFGKFARLSARPTGGEHSTGLGLSIVKKMVEAMHGRVWCESELGKGAMFIVELPKATMP